MYANYLTEPQNMRATISMLSFGHTTLTSLAHQLSKTKPLIHSELQMTGDRVYLAPLLVSN